MNKTAYVVARLREDLAAGTIQPGQQLRQAEIADRYGVSPTPVREALRLLEADGSIRYSPHRGATVTELTPLEFSDLYDMRILLESSLTRLAAERASEGDVAELRALHAGLESRSRAASAEELSRQNREFHFAVLRLGSRLITEQVIVPLWHGFLPPTHSQWRHRKNNAMFITQHERIIRALEQHDPVEAEASMADHLRCAMQLRQESQTTAPGAKVGSKSPAAKRSATTKKA